MSDQSVGNFFGNLAFNLSGVALVEGAVKAVERLNDAMERRNKVLNALNTIYDGDADKASKLIGINANAAELATARAAKGASRLERAFHLMSVAQMAYAAVVGFAGRVTNFFTGAMNQASEAVDLGQRLGMTASAVQELGYVAGQSGGDLQTLTQGLTGLSNKLDEARKGGKDAAASLRAVGLKGGTKLGLDEALGQIADRFAKMPDGAKKSALAVDLFGKAGAKLIPMLNQGREGIGNLRKEARDLGIVIDDDAAAAMEGMQDEGDKLKLTLAGIRNSVVSALLPALTSLVRATQAWVTEHREGIVKFVTGGMRVLIGVMQVASTVLGGVAAVVAFLGDNSDVLIAILAGVTAVVYKLAAGFVVLKVQAALAWAATLGPIALLFVAVTAGVLLLLRFRSVGTAVLQALGRAVTGLGSVFVSMWNAIKSGASSVWDSLKAFGRGFIDFFKGVGKAIKNAFLTVAQWVVDRVNDLIDLLNKLPFVSIGRIGRVDGGGDRTGAPAPASSPTQPTVPAAAAGGGKQVAMTNNVTINAPNADAQQVAKLVDENLSHRLREADAAIA
jgi:hypothetical protein